MPYSSIAELPESVRKVLPESAQKMWMEVCNAALKTYNGDESKAFATAWAAVGKKYEKGEDGMWRMKGSFATFAVELENWAGMSWIPVAKVGQKTKMSDGIIRSLTKEALQNSVDTWNGGRITKDHNELVMGLQIQNAKFEEPFLYMQFDPTTLKYITCDKSSGRSVEFIATKVDDSQILDGYGAGLSVLFPPKIPACDRAMGCFEANFEKDSKKPYGDVDYADPGYQEDGVYRYPLDTEKHVRAAWSYINMPKNQKAYTSDQLANIKAKIKSAAKKFGIEIKFENNINGQETEMTEEQLQAQIKDLTANFEKKAAEVQTLQDELASSKARLAEFEKKEAERLKSEIKAEFQKYIDDGVIPAGKVHTPEDRAALEAMFETEPRKFTRLIADMKLSKGTGKTGAEFMQTETDDDEKQDAEAYDELRAARAGIMPHRTG